MAFFIGGRRIRRRIAVLLLILTTNGIWVSVAIADDDEKQQQQQQRQQQQQDEIIDDSYYFDGIGGEKASFNNATPFWDATYENFPTYRSDVCERYALFRKGELDLQDALRGLELTTVFYRNQVNLIYSPKDGINTDYPGLAAYILDLIAERAGFTWRNSFAFTEVAPEYDLTWDQLLWWSVNTFDIAANWWDHALDRLEMGVAFTVPWYDGSIILIDKLLTEDQITEWDIGVLWNWTRPFQPSVWVSIFITIFLSGLVYQLIEYIQGDQQGRPMREWFMDNFYLSILNATTHFGYEPTTAAGRIFSISMATWALIISATYTANLAGLFVDQAHIKPRITSIEEAVAQKIPICTLAESNSDEIIRERYYSAERRPQPAESVMFDALRAGECSLIAVSLDGWRVYRGQTAYNPDCSLGPIGQPIAEVKSGFAVKPDVEYKCTSLVRDVLNLYFYQLIEEGELQEARRQYQMQEWDIDCAAKVPEAIGNAVDEYMSHGTRKRQLARNTQEQRDSSHRRRLKDSASEGGGDNGEGSLSLQEMMGTFCLHYGMMLLAVVASLLSSYWTKGAKSRGMQQQAFRRTTGGSSVGKPNPIGKPKGLSINACVIPEGAPLDNTEEITREDFLNEHDSVNDGGMGKLTYHLPAHSEGEIVDSASFLLLKKHFDEKLQKATDQFESRLDQLEQQTGLIITLLQDMRRDESQKQGGSHRERNGSGRRQGEHNHSQDLNGSDQHAIAEQRSGRHDFGNYLRQSTPTQRQSKSKSQTQKKYFGRYLLHHSEEDLEEP